MKKIKYYYNTNTLRYEKLETPLRVTLLRILGFLSASLVTALILVTMAYRYFPSVNEKRLIQNNETLKDNYFVLNEQVKKMQEQIMGWKNGIMSLPDHFEANPFRIVQGQKTSPRTGISTGSGNGSGQSGFFCRQFLQPWRQNCCTDQIVW
jgi:hypothetical protein